MQTKNSFKKALQEERSSLLTRDAPPDNRELSEKFNEQEE